MRTAAFWLSVFRWALLFILWCLLGVQARRAASPDGRGPRNGADRLSPPGPPSQWLAAEGGPSAAAVIGVCAAWPTGTASGQRRGATCPHPGRARRLGNTLITVAPYCPRTIWKVDNRIHCVHCLILQYRPGILANHELLVPGQGPGCQGPWWLPS